MSSSRRSTGSQSGFTLVELLVVIGIIAVLIAILLPALQSARKQAATVKCLAHLRQLSTAYLLYAGENKQMFPLVRMDITDDGGTVPGAPVRTGHPYVNNIYWQDVVAKYLTAGKMNFQGNKNDLDIARQSVLWGCPEWQGYQTTGTFPVNRNNNGYSPNLYPTASPTNPRDPHAMPGRAEMQVRWRNSSTWTFPGKAYKVSQWTQASERMLLADATLWFFEFKAVPAGGKIAPLGVGQVNSGAWPGGNNYDRYRHGKYPETEVAQFNAALRQYKPTGGKVAYNVAFADGHAATLTDIAQGYKAVRMIDPPQ